MNLFRLVIFAIIFAFVTFTFCQAFAEEDSSKILKEILVELKEIKKELRNSLIIQNNSQLLLKQIEYQRQILNQYIINSDTTRKEIEGIENASLEVTQRIEDLRSEMSSKIITDPNSTDSNTEYNNLLVISDQQQKQLGTLKNKLNEIVSNIADINKTINELLVKYKNAIQLFN